MTPEQLEALATRGLRIENSSKRPKYAGITYSVKNNQVIYSPACKDPEIAQELISIQEGEQSFAELARKYCTRSEAQTGGIVGPVGAEHTPSSFGPDVLA